MGKQSLRERVWDDLEESGAARFPFPPHGRIPNFAGAEQAAEHLAATPAWEAADVVKANPDAPQLPVRRRALHEGKTVYMAVPRLRDEKCFLALDPARIADEDMDSAATISHVEEYAVQAGPEDLPHVDLVVSGSVAVTEGGARVGKGEGYSDLEFAMLAEFDLVDEDTTVATTVHEQQIVAEDVPVGPHDVPMDVIVTPERTVEVSAAYRRPTGIIWDAVSEERRAEIPVLQRLRP